MKPAIKCIILLLSFLTLFAVEPTIPLSVSAQEGPLALAFYYAWFDQNTWASGQSVDLPVEPYNSADRTTIERHVAQAQGAGLDALVQAWYGPQEANNQTETNFRILLDVAEAKGLKAAVDFETTGPFFDNAGAVTSALTTLLATHVQHPAYLRYQGKPVIFFWRQQRFSVDEWATIRNQVDPNHTTHWIAEGVEIAYQAVFDGHHLYSIAWAASPSDQLTKWGSRVRAYEAENQVDRLWVATAMPGYDDTRLSRPETFAVPRLGGDYYRETWRGAVASQPDMIIVTSFNEWPEGTHIEPSASYGNLYLEITRELITDWRGSPPAGPPPGLAAQQQAPTAAPESPETPSAGPYIQTASVTNVRRGPDTGFSRVGTLAAGSTTPVIGQTESGDWWLIDFEAGPDGQGWVSAEAVEFVGEAADVPVVEAPTPEVTTPATGDEVSEETASVSGNKPALDTPVVKVPAGGVNVRTGPGLDYDLIGRLDENTSAVVVAQNETKDWWQIEYQDGENGQAWVAEAVVDFEGDRNRVPVVTTSQEEDFAPIATPTPTPTIPVIAGRVEAIDPINVRAEPSLDGARIGGLYPGEAADVLAISDDGEWWQIDFGDAPDGVGWVAVEFVSFEGDRLAVPIFGLGTPTPTPGPTATPTAPPPLPTATPLEWPVTYAPTATSAYQATSAALLTERGTPDPAVTTLRAEQRSSFQWGDVPWGLFSALVVIGLFWYQFYQRRRKSRSKF